MGEKLQAFRRNLTQIPSPRNLKVLQGLITPPKGVKRKQRYKTSETEPVDEGDELFDCVGDKLVLNEHNEEHQSDEENDANVETGAIENQDENDQVNVNTISSSNILLGDLCRGNNDLRKDVVFIDILGKLLGNAETSTQFIPYLTKFKQSYITSRRAIKRRVENMVNNNLDLEAGDDEQLENKVEHCDENDPIRNAFADLFHKMDHVYIFFKCSFSSAKSFLYVGGIHPSLRL